MRTRPFCGTEGGVRYSRASEGRGDTARPAAAARLRTTASWRARARPAQVFSRVPATALELKEVSGAGAGAGGRDRIIMIIIIIITQ